jgi:uncharacterized protein (TIGR02145 family)
MKNLLLIAFFSLCSIVFLEAQNGPVVPKKMYKTWVKPKNGIKGENWLLFEVKDSAVLLSDSPRRQDYTIGDYDVLKVDIKNIDVLKVRHKGSQFAILIGGVSGMILGVFLADWYEKHLANNMEPVAYTLGGGFMAGIFPFIISTGIGVGIGAIFSSKISIPINRNQGNFNKQKKALNGYAILDNPYLSGVITQSFSRLRDSVSDVDGNMYHTLALGGQVWMAENLKVTHYRNGGAIPDVAEVKDWVKTLQGSSCWFMNDPGKAVTYGKIYNWNAVSDSRGLCPKGWHVPSFSEWSSLITCLGGESGAGEKLTQKIARQPSAPDQPNITGNPFALPGGFRFSTGEFSSEQAPSYQWWSATPQDSTAAKAIQLGNDVSGIFFTGSGRRSGLSVRCMRD